MSSSTNRRWQAVTARVVRVLGFLVTAALLLNPLAGKTAYAAAAATTTTTTATSSASLRFAPLPMVDERTLREQFLPMLGYLERKTGLHFRWQYIPEYQGILESLEKNRLDLAFLGPLPYVELRRKDAQVAPLVHFLESNGRASYECALVGFAPDGLNSPQTVENKRIGLTQAQSTCGPFAVSLMLKRAGRRLNGDGNQSFFADSHKQAILGVLQGRFDVAGVKLSIARRYAGLGIHVIDQIGPFPGFALVANQRTLTTAQMNAIRQALLEATPEERKSWGSPMRNGCVVAHDSDYDGIRQDLKRLGDF